MPPNLVQDLAFIGDESLVNNNETSRILRCALLGCGMMGQEHISYISGYPSKIRIDFLCDPHEPSIEKSLQVLREFDQLGGPPPKVFHNEDDLLRLATSIDLLVIATPNYMHTDTIIRWADEDLTILCEKPVAVSQEQHDKLKCLQKSGDLRARLWVAMEYRYIPAIAQLCHLLPSIGDIKMLTIRENRYPFLHKIGKWNRNSAFTGDTLVEKCCHFFDLFRLITGKEVDLSKVKALTQRGVNYEDEDPPPDGKAPIIDSAYVMFPMTNTPKSSLVMACLELNMFAEGSRHQEEIVVTGTKGRLEAYLPENKVYAYRRPTQEEWKDRSVPPPKDPSREKVYDCADVSAVFDIHDKIPTHGGYHYSSTAVEWFQLLHAIRNYEDSGQWKPEVSLLDGLAAVQIGIQATKTMEEC